MSYKILLACFLFCSCTASRMIETDIYFAQSKPDGSLISENDWKSFRENQIARVCKEGSSVINVSGNWYDPDSHKLITEPTYLVIYFHKNAARVSGQLDSLANLYKKMFQQQSVLRVDKKVRVTF